jgi:hypothetical protein
VDVDLLGGFGSRGFVGSFDELAVDEYRAGSVAVTNRRDTAERDVAAAACSARVPTGSSPAG